MKNKFAERLNYLLKIRGYSQLGFAKQFKIKQSTISGWCIGRSEPDFDTLLKLCKLLDETPNFLLGWEN